MAKQKPEATAPEAPAAKPAAPPAETPAVQAPAPVPIAKAAVPAVRQQYQVTLKHFEPTVIQASSSEEAWEKFKAHWGILASDWTPEILPLPLSGLSEKP